MQTPGTLLAAQELEELPAEQVVQLTSLLEAFFSPNEASRMRAFEALHEMHAHQRSPLVASLFCHALREPDLGLRGKILDAVAESMSASESDAFPSQRVRNGVNWVLRRMERGEIKAILQIAHQTPAAMRRVCFVLNACSHSGEILLDLITDRDQDLGIRQAAIEALGELGFLEAKPMLEHMEKRLADQSRQQLPMPFAAPTTIEAQFLLPAVRLALEQLSEAAL